MKSTDKSSSLVCLLVQYSRDAKIAKLQSSFFMDENIRSYNENPTISSDINPQRRSNLSGWNNNQRARPQCRAAKLTFDVSVHDSSIVKTFQSFTKFSGNHDNVPFPELIVCGTHLVPTVSLPHLDHRPPNQSNKIGFTTHLICGRITSTKTFQQQVCASKPNYHHRCNSAAAGFHYTIQEVKEGHQSFSKRAQPGGDVDDEQKPEKHSPRS